MEEFNCAKVDAHFRVLANLRMLSCSEDDRGLTNSRDMIALAREHPVGHEIEALDQFEAWLRLLPGKLAALCRLMYVDGANQLEAAARLGLSQSRVSTMHREALSILDGSWNSRVLDQESA